MVRQARDLSSDESAGIQSVEVAGVILKALLRSHQPQRLSVVARSAEMAPAKVHRYLVSLIRTGLVTQDRVTGLYDLGPIALQMGLMGFSRFDALRFAAETLERIVEQVGETAALSVWGEHGPKFVRMVEARHGQASSTPVTHICPMTWSATGFVYSAYETPERIAHLIKRELQQNKLLQRQDSPQTSAELASIVGAVRVAGFAVVPDGGGGGTSGISAPIFGVTGEIAMALTVFARAGRIDTSTNSGVVQVVVQAARDLSEALGFTGHAAEAPVQRRAAKPPRRAAKT